MSKVIIKFQREDAFKISNDNIEKLKNTTKQDFADYCNAYLTKTILDGSSLPGPVVQYEPRPQYMRPWKYQNAIVSKDSLINVMKNGQNYIDMGEIFLVQAPNQPAFSEEYVRKICNVDGPFDRPSPKKDYFLLTGPGISNIPIFKFY